MNRYDNGTVSKFNPLTLNEILLAPTVMREKHDKSIAAAEALRIKANPLDKHLNRTLELKNQMDSEISKNVDELNSKGYNPTTFQNIVKLNREYQDLISPTGEVGQINNAKIVYDTEKENFLKSAEANKIGRDQALKKWAEKTSNYTGFGEDGKSIKNVTPQGVAAFQDYGQQLSRAHSILGETIKGFPTGGGYHLEKASDGGTVFVDKQGSRVTGNNARQVESAYKSFRDSWINGEGADYSRDAGLGIDEERIRNDFNSMLKTSDITKEDISRNYNSPVKGSVDKNSPNTAIAETVGIGAEIEEALKSLDRYKIEPRNIPSMNQEPGSSGTDQTGGTIKGDKGKEIHFANSLTKSQQKLYAETYNAKVAQGKIKKGTNMYSTEAVKAVEEDWKTRKNFNFTNSVIIPGSSESQILESPSLDRGEAKDRDMFVANRLSLARKNGQQLFFNEDGKSIDLKDIKGSVRLVGHYNPSNILKPFGGNPDNTVSPHVVSYLGTDDKMHTALMPRDLNETKNNPAFKAAKMINKTVNKSTVNANNFTTFNSKEYPELKNADLSPLGINERGVDGVRVKYSPDEDSFTLEILKNGGRSKTTALSNKEYQMLMYDIIE